MNTQYNDVKTYRLKKIICFGNIDLYELKEV